jgi:hypothetical protein
MSSRMPLSRERSRWLQHLLTFLLLAEGISSFPVQAQMLKPEKVFRKEIIERKLIRSATFTLLDEYRIPISETYYFSSDGIFTGCIRNSANGIDTLYKRDIGSNIIREKGRQRDVSTTLELDSSHRLVRKVNMVDDTLHSVVTLYYDEYGKLAMTAELNREGDTVATATYFYEGKRVRQVVYTGLEILRIEYLKKGNRLTERAYNNSGEVMFNRVEMYKRSHLLRAQTVSVPGIKIVPTTRFRYRGGLLRAVIQPDGTRVRIVYSYSERSIT